MDKPIKILYLAANPKDTNRLRLDEEMRGIDHALRQAEFRDRFEIKQHWAVRIVDLQGYLLRHKPDIVHFSGHGSASSEIILEDSYGNNQAVSNQALGQLFAVLKDNIRCVVLNACYSELQAQSIAKYIDCVIGMSKTIGDAAAISFAISFYQALGYGRDIKTAFDLGCTQINLESLNQADTPKMIAINNEPQKIILVTHDRQIAKDENTNSFTATQKKQRDKIENFWHHFLKEISPLFILQDKLTKRSKQILLITYFLLNVLISCFHKFNIQDESISTFLYFVLPVILFVVFYKSAFHLAFSAWISLLTAKLIISGSLEGLFNLVFVLGVKFFIVGLAIKVILTTVFDKFHTY